MSLQNRLQLQVSGPSRCSAGFRQGSSVSYPKGLKGTWNLKRGGALIRYNMAKENILYSFNCCPLLLLLLMRRGINVRSTPQSVQSDALKYQAVLCCPTNKG